MYKLWRRELSNPIGVELTSKKKQSAFTQILTQIIKITKKKEQLYIQILFSNGRPLSSDQHDNTSRSLKNLQYQNQIEGILSEEDEQMSSFKQYEGQTFFLSKTYLYTLYVRLMEIFEFARQKILMRIKSDEKVQSASWEKYYDDNKMALSECYQNLIYFQNYNIAQFLALVTRKQNHRIYSLVPPKAKKTQLTLKPLIRLSSTDLKNRTSVSITHINAAKKQEDMNQIIEKKLSRKHKKLQTQKRLEERESKKVKKNPIMTFKGLYGILNVKLMKIEEGYAFSKGLQIELMQRNAQILQSRKQYQKQYEQRKTRRILKSKKQ